MIMVVLAQGFAVLVALIHIYIVILEMYLWDKPKGLAVFRMTKEKAEITKSLATNQGLYNGFLAAGILWGFLRGDSGVIQFFLSCVAVAGICGAITVNKRIFYVQTVPAALGLIFYFLA
jgi:putative membrane protein